MAPTLSLDEIMSVGRDIQNRSSRRVGAKVVEDRFFKEYFGVCPLIVSIVWNLLAQHDLIPEKGEIKYLLWALVFLKVYPKQGLVCSLVGGSNGAVDPKTFRKWVWKFIFNISFLDEVVVSNEILSHSIIISPLMMCFFSSMLSSSPIVSPIITSTRFCRLILKVGRTVAV